LALVAGTETVTLRESTGIVVDMRP